ncbi:hypothetical protein MNBD_NITROSPINAE04-1734 [hydrothermal vent metagenome]|uniref:GerMN domain-containing protein n=1 Tax=hydrothermal vent metagenome TaxID=652676 RepID=A0A3B1BZQ6_9ZZZZ
MEAPLFCKNEKRLKIVKKKSARRYWLWILILAFLGIIVWSYPAPDRDTGPHRPVGTKETTAIKHSGPNRKIVLFTPDKNGERLVKVEASIDSQAPVEDQIRQALSLLFTAEGLPAPLFPEGMIIREAFVYDRTAIISLGEDFRKKLAGGVWTELLAVYSIVNTLSANFEGIDQTQILINDHESDFFISHVSISKAIKADLSFTGETTDKDDSGEPL